VVPEGLTAAQYLDLGKQYKAVGWPEQARGALTRSIKADPDGVGKKAETYLRAYVPRDRVPDAAVEMNILGYNLLARGDQAGAIQAFQDCITQFPNFEWPYGNLGSIYVKQGRTQEAKDILQKALTINPSYVNGWIHLAEARLKEGDGERSPRGGQNGAANRSGQSARKASAPPRSANVKGCPPRLQPAVGGRPVSPPSPLLAFLSG
jgi:predicted Zn-dependent protease